MEKISTTISYHEHKRSVKFTAQNGKIHSKIIGNALFCEFHFNSLSANFTKWSNTLKQFVGNLPTNYLSAFGHFVGLALKGLRLTCPFKKVKNT